ncbi:ferric reductase-like transmembrane domain-containing protein [Novosphingobium mangrovi (ex Hu et al. 2023)]|uniref:Ferric reductase-like transmembrane domain-containing protein n=1 Tax=Novosphingobium mangrovi (ex Hu et al. 2023) TaxID=2930094 RepID=A0ABT0AF63_9SPHN|nr:ferric reductase-like transmembrane domain-containing protein [Novosphingobium mangrovi (ex Hu et al. 2023)]MCJ1961846.1 ferric reductase-like transmembrane domain-containing protein [Novosphingobium mangrovi (ex Hu et al. 2023)]
MKRARLSLLVSLALAIPGLLMVWDLLANAAWPMGLLSPSGELAMRLMVLAMLPGPLVELVGTNRFLKGWLLIRRNLGVAAFGYGLLHLAFYVIDMTPEGIVSELGLPGIWTGWLALACLLIPASISFNTAVRRLGRRWKTLQRLVYPALLLALAHWLLLGWSSTPALVHVAPLVLVWAARAWKRHRIRKGAFTA